MRIYYNLDEVEEGKRVYASVALSSKVRVEYEYKKERGTFLPYTIGDLTVLLDITDENEIIEELLHDYIRSSMLKKFPYPEEIIELSKHFKTDLKKFRILVVKYNTVEEKEFSRYSLSNITFGVISYNGFDIHLLPSNVKIGEKEGYCVSSIVDKPEEGIRQALLIARWFGSGNYNELPKLAFERSIELGNWTNLVKYVLFEEFDDTYFSVIIKKINEFRKETYFDPFVVQEKVALGIALSKFKGGGYFEPDSYDII